MIWPRSRPAAQFADQLQIIKSQVAELERYGRIARLPSLRTLWQGEQLTATIVAAATFADIGEDDPAGKLGRLIRGNDPANSKF